MDQSGWLDSFKSAQVQKIVALQLYAQLSADTVPCHHTPQVDLSDDEVVAAMAMEKWEDEAEAIKGKDDQGSVQSLELTREGFYGLVSVVKP